MSKKKVRRAGIVAVLEQLGQWKLEWILVKADGALDVAAY